MPAQPALEEARRCPDCGGTALPEEDGEARYWACEDCEYEFGWALLGRADTCAAGLPIQVQTAPALVFIPTIGRRTP